MPELANLGGDWEVLADHLDTPALKTFRSVLSASLDGIGGHIRRLTRDAAMANGGVLSAPTREVLVLREVERRFRRLRVMIDERLEQRRAAWAKTFEQGWRQLKHAAQRYE